MRRCLECGAGLAVPAWTCSACGASPPMRDGIPHFAPEQAELGTGFDAAAFDALAVREDASFWFRRRNALISWALDAHFPRAAGFLEIGCGTGYVLAGLAATHPELALTGAELHPQGLVHARARVPCAEFLQLDARAVPFEDEFDVVGAFDVLEHVDDDEGFLAGMARSARPGGGVLVTVPQHQWLWSDADAYARHERRYSRDELVDKVERTGLVVERVTSFVTTLLPLMVASRLWQRLRRAPYDPTREHDAATHASGLLERALDIDIALIRRGVSLPAGGSLLLVARRL